MKQKPGVMIYFDICDALELLTNEQRGQIMMAILDYGENGIFPEFEDAALAMCWAFVKKRLDADDERYRKATEQRANAARKRWQKKEKSETDSTECEAMRNDATECEAMRNMPTTTPTTTTATTTATTTTTRERERFAPPTLDEVAAYCRERGNQVDAQRFIDHYTSNGWLVGKNRMKDWRAAVRTWESRENDQPPAQMRQRQRGNVYAEMLKAGVFDDE